jgi:hypothetical protein
MHEVRFFPKQLFPLAERFPNQTYFTVLQITQAAVNDARGAAGYSRSEVILLDQQGMFARAGALPRYSDAIDAAANHHYLKVLAFQGSSGICR